VAGSVGVFVSISDPGQEAQPLVFLCLYVHQCVLSIHVFAFVHTLARGQLKDLARE